MNQELLKEITQLDYEKIIHSVETNLESIISVVSSKNLKLIVSGLILLPVFFQISSGIFNDKALLYDTKGLLNNLPIPISVIACMLGFILFNDYKKSREALTVILVLFVFMIISTIVTTNSDLYFQQSKMIFMIQFLIPLLALVLGDLNNTTI